MNKLTARARITEVDGLSDSIIRIFGADSRRDEAIRNLGALLSGYAVFPLEEKKAAALGLKAVYDKYAKSGILSASYISESSMIESLLGDFSSEEAVASIEKLDGISEMVAAVRAAQDDFTAANDAFVKAEGSKGASASSYKKPILAVINDKIVPYLNTMAIVGNTEVADFAKGVETEITRVNENIAKRGK